MVAVKHVVRVNALATRVGRRAEVVDDVVAEEERLLKRLSVLTGQQFDRFATWDVEDVVVDLEFVGRIQGIVGELDTAPIVLRNVVPHDRVFVVWICQSY